MDIILTDTITGESATVPADQVESVLSEWNPAAPAEVIASIQMLAEAIRTEQHPDTHGLESYLAVRWEPVR